MNKLYAYATALFIFLALLQTLFFPIIGGINGFVILLLLTGKMIVGKIRDKFMTTTKTTVYNTPDGPLKVTQKIPNKVMQSGGSGMATKANIYALIIDYLTTPMDQFEKGLLILGWALWPIFFPLLPTAIFLAIKDQCTVVGTDWCSLLNSLGII